MRSVFSAMRRSLTRAAMVAASSNRGARNTSRSVSRTGTGSACKLSGASGSSSVIARAPQKREGSRHPVSPHGTRVGPPVRWMPADVDLIRRLFGRSLGHREHRYEDPALGFGTELDATFGQRKQRVVLAQADIGAGVPFGAALARDDVAGEHLLTAENLQAEPLTVGVAAVAG